MELVYLWIKEYKNIVNQDFNFTQKFKCSYKSNRKELNIEKQEFMNIYPQNVNFSAIVGKNGVGKSNLVRFFSEIQNYTHFSKNDKSEVEDQFKDLDYVIVFLMHGKLWIFHPYLKKINCNELVIYDPSICFHTEFNFAFYNTSAFEEYTYKKDLTPLYETIKAHTNYDYLVQTIMESSQNDTLKNIYNAETVRFELFSIRYSFEIVYFNHFFNYLLGYTETLNDEVYDIHREKEYNKPELINYFSNNINFPLNYEELAPNQIMLIIKIMLNGGVERLQKYIHSDEDYFDILAIIFGNENNYPDNDKLSKFFLENLYFQNSDSYMDEKVILNVDIRDLEIWNLYSEGIERLISQDIVEDKLIISINNTKINISHLSSGEKSNLLLKLVINKLIKGYESIKNNKSLIILLDEPETYLHPNMQKNLISDLSKVFEKIDFDIHFIITTHSPFILSDLDKGNIVFLDKVDDDIEKRYDDFKKGSLENGYCVNVSEFVDIKKTFGANIHSLLFNGFFMNDGVMGKFSKSILNNILMYLTKRVKNINLSQNEIKIVINSVGEELLRSKLESLYAEFYDIETKEEKYLSEIYQLKSLLEKAQIPYDKNTN